MRIADVVASALLIINLNLNIIKMKTLFGSLIGLATAIIVVFMANFVIYLLDIDKNESSFFVGWISCMGYYISIYIFDEWRKQH